jgi:hypothetical protein
MNGEQFDIGSDIATGPTGEGGNESQTPTPEPTAQPGVAVDLAAWARGDQEAALAEVEKAINNYIFDEVWKIVEPRLVTIKSRGDALDFLIDEGIISSLEARGDA